jgi:hypothetical protein
VCLVCGQSRSPLASQADQDSFRQEHAERCHQNVEPTGFYADIVADALTLGAAVEEIMLFGEAPCSPGRMKHRRVCYLGLLGLATNGQCDISAPYAARYGQPRPGQKVFVVTCQTKNGWKAQDHETSAIVPRRPSPSEQLSIQPTKAEEAATTGTPEAQAAPAQGSSSLPRLVYKGSTPDVRGLHKGLKLVHPWSILCTPLVHDLRRAIARLGAVGMAGVGG